LLSTTHVPLLLQMDASDLLRDFASSRHPEVVPAHVVVQMAEQALDRLPQDQDWTYILFTSLHTLTLTQVGRQLDQLVAVQLAVRSLLAQQRCFSGAY
jgi:hypothetical protein